MDGDKLTCAPGSRSDASKGKQEDSLESHFDEHKIVLSYYSLFLCLVKRLSCARSLLIYPSLGGLSRSPKITPLCIIRPTIPLTETNIINASI